MKHHYVAIIASRPGRTQHPTPAPRRAAYPDVSEPNIRPPPYNTHAGRQLDRPQNAEAHPTSRVCAPYGLDRLLIVGRRHLEHVLRVYVKHYNRQRPHRALDLKPPDAIPPSGVAAGPQPRDLHVHRRDLLGGLIHEYELAAA